MIAKRRPGVFGVLAAAVVLAAAGPAMAGDGASVGAKAPAFKLTGIDGRTYNLAALNDKVVVLEWFNQDCPFSKKAAPATRELAKKYAEQGVVWLAIDSTHYQTAEKNQAYKKANKLPFPILMDTDGEVGREYGAKTTPHMFVINKGTVAYAGALDDQKGRSYVDEALAAILSGKDVPLAQTPPYGCPVKYAKGSAQKADKATAGEAAPNFELTGIDGKQYKLADYQDKLVVLEWFSSDCPVTKRYTPTMKKLADEYGKQGVVWLAIDSTHYQKAENDRKYHDQYKLPYPILMDTDGKVGRTYGAKTTPHMFVVNKGKLIYSGAIDDRGKRNYVAETLDAVLAGKDVPLAQTQSFGCSVKYGK